jgi:N-terminal domain of toast_rack, DUF2154/Domain of unknown function (DUF5668)
MPDQPNQTPRRQPSLVLPLVLIVVGALFLYANWRPAFDPWPILRTYWPLILIFFGLGKMWDATRQRSNPDGARRGSSAGSTIGILIFVLLMVALFWHGRAFSHDRRSEWEYESRSVQRQNAKSVHASVQASSGELTVTGDGNDLLDADFTYSRSYDVPRVEYNVSDGIGYLNISQDDHSAMHFGSSHNGWNLRFANDVPIELKVEMGAGRGDLNLRDMHVTRLNVQMGAGQLDLDLTGDRKDDLTGDLEGGVGQATIRLPSNVGVSVRASGGIGSVDAQGLQRNGDEYVNDAYGKTPATIRLKIEGGVGSISLISARSAQRD